MMMMMDDADEEEEEEEKKQKKKKTDNDDGDDIEVLILFFVLSPGHRHRGGRQLPEPQPRWTERCPRSLPTGDRHGVGLACLDPDR